LKAPFALKDGQRQDDTQVHVALREALVNTLVHADYTGRVSILVVKRPDLFGFRNPGCLRLPLEQVLQGGTSDCRNRLMHQMFLMIGLGERGGSGIPKIFSGWQSEHWRQPVLREVEEPEQTLLELHMLDLLPESVLADLRQRFGDKFNALERGRAPHLGYGGDRASGQSCTAGGYMRPAFIRSESQPGKAGTRRDAGVERPVARQGVLLAGRDAYFARSSVSSGTRQLRT